MGSTLLPRPCQLSAGQAGSSTSQLPNLACRACNGANGRNTTPGRQKNGEVGQPFLLLGLVGFASAKGPLSRETHLFLVALYSAVVTSDTSFTACGLAAFSSFAACGLAGLGSSLINRRNAWTKKLNTRSKTSATVTESAFASASSNADWFTCNVKNKREAKRRITSK